MNVHAIVTSIIEPTTKLPTIINDESNFVVITYWWGRNKLNPNTGRPCTSFYEDNLKKINKIILELLSTVHNYKNVDINTSIQTIFRNFERNASVSNKINKIISDEILVDYLNELAEYLKISPNVIDMVEKYRLIKEKLPYMIEYNDLLSKVREIIITGVIRNQNNLIKFQKLNMEVYNLRKRYVSFSLSHEKNKNSIIGYKVENLMNIELQLFDITARNRVVTDEELNNIKKNVKNKELLNMLKQIKKLNDVRDKISNDIIKVFKKKYKQEDDSLKNIYDLLRDTLEYKPAIKFEEMIIKWEESCITNNCNYLSVEYPEFAADTGEYQLAINAKPKFIEKALELCGTRSVLYIDGDMFIKKYPSIFDMKSIDYMARGWYIDPRSSWKMNESIMYDPYDFETSGGTMFFSSSNHAKRLLKLWIAAAEEPFNNGKADDRVLSLIFNSKAVLTWCRIIQLPVEYLWLTLDYDERMMELYDYNKELMDSTLFIDHPECLTSEDTATGAGAASSRQPKYSSFLEDLYPSVEVVHEYIMFKELEKNNEHTPNTYLPYLFWYNSYMADLQYIDDGNPDLIDQGFVHPDSPSENECPLTIVSYYDTYGNLPHPRDEGKSTLIQIAESNSIKITDIPLDFHPTIIERDTYIEIIPKDPEQVRDPVLLQIIIYYLKVFPEKPIIYNPKNFQEYNINLFNTLIEKMDEVYENTHFVFNPIHRISIRRSDFLKPEINLSQPMLFRYEERLIDYLLIQLSLQDFSTFISIGSYHFMSLVSVGFLLRAIIPIVSRPSLSNITGGSMKETKDLNYNLFINEYIEAFETPLDEIRNFKKKPRSKIIAINSIGNTIRGSTRRGNAIRGTTRRGSTRRGSTRRGSVIRVSTRRGRSTHKDSTSRAMTNIKSTRKKRTNK